MQTDKSALIAMSGGVDSSVAAYLMVKNGYRCQAATMRLYRNSDIGLGNYRTCCSQRDIDDAGEVAFLLDIPYEVVDFVGDFKEKVIEKFIRIYEQGGTPNPCIDCNRYLKFEKLFEYADEQGLSYVVTGHYARIEYDASVQRYILRKALDDGKDQSYVLYMLTQNQLSRLKFPLGDMKKTQARLIAEQQGFCNSRKHDSQDICFVPDGDYVKFIEQYTGKKYSEGCFVDSSGNIVGKHRGALRYTIGQRRGLGIPAEKPLYVLGKNMTDNTVVVGYGEALYNTALYADDINWLSIPPIKNPIRCKAKIRYRQQEQPATVYPLGENCIKVVFDQPQRAITAGQAVVLYDGDTVLGGGTITDNDTQI
ncbi:MAG: tRNA 2-thiouridine(34) synthase MnmA [Clostridia bacterium]|nr:tRNA 2-thiouridine(34) synthase MnmA [Clostridia bacterium]